MVCMFLDLCFHPPSLCHRFSYHVQQSPAVDSLSHAPQKHNTPAPQSSHHLISQLKSPPHLHLTDCPQVNTVKDMPIRQQVGAYFDLQNSIQAIHF
jgi:hypothetical protein